MPSIPAIHHLVLSGDICIAMGSEGRDVSGRLGKAAITPLSPASAVIAKTAPKSTMNALRQMFTGILLNPILPCVNKTWFMVFDIADAAFMKETP